MRSQWKGAGKGKSEITFFKHLDFSGFDSLLCFDVFMFKLNVQSHNDTIFTKCVGRIAAVAVTSFVFLMQKTQKMWRDLSEISCLFLIKNNQSGFGGTMAKN